MFRWYSDAVKCYAYLPDVPVSDSGQCEEAFTRSRYFTRGWTVQELLAPVLVEFFSKDGERVGDRLSLLHQIHDITGIGVEALQGKSLSEFSVDERLSWAARRETKREEDAAYSLLGIFDANLPLIYGEGREKAMIRLMREIKENEKHDASALPAKNRDTSARPEVHSAPWIVPFERNPRFTGRESQLQKLKRMLFGRDHTAKVAIMGLGGVGKTQLVLELIHQVREEHKDCAVIWIPAMSMESLGQGYVDVARQLGISGGEEDKVDAKRVVQDYLSNRSAGRWMMVFGNADDLDMWIAKRDSEPGAGRLIDHLPKNQQGCIIFTTRDRKTAVKLAHQNVVEVGEMKEDVAKILLQKHLIDPYLTRCQQDADALLVQLAYLPLAIVQAAAYVNENGGTLAEYLSLLAEQEEGVIDLLSEEFEDDARYVDIKNPVATTWLISFERIRNHDPLAADYLSFMACIEPKDIPQLLLPPGISRKKEIDAIGTLDAYSFVRRRPADFTIDLHRLVHLATRNWLRKQGLLAEWTSKAILRLEETFPDSSYESRSVWRTYLPHVDYVLDSDLVDRDSEHRTNLMSRFAICLFRDGRYNEAAIHCKAVMESRVKLLGEGRHDTLVSMSDLALILMNQGKFEATEETGWRALKGYEKTVGNEHPDTLTAVSVLASVLREQGKYVAAEKMNSRALEGRGRVLGKEHPKTLTSMANLASTYRDQGRWKEAKELQATELQICSRVLGDEHPSTLMSKANLAVMYQKLGQFKEAEELESSVVEARKRMLGEEHPETLQSIGNLASVYFAQERWREAQDLWTQATGTKKRVLGEEHPETLSSKNNLSLSLWMEGRQKEAEELAAEVMEVMKRVLGKRYPDVLISMYNLAGMFKAQGRDEEAISLGRECFVLRKEVLGPQHPDTTLSKEALDAWQSEAEKQGDECSAPGQVLWSRRWLPSNWRFWESK